ncbi:MAG: hypothetical protein ACRC9V_02710, partial [Aeromonas sp.]
MSEFFKRWLSRKNESRQGIPSRPAADELTSLAPLPNGLDEGLIGEILAGREVGTDKLDVSSVGSDAVALNPVGSDMAEGDALAVAEPASETPLYQGEQDKSGAALSRSTLPDKETLRAMFRTHQPDGLDDYTQDFTAPELLPAALSAGLRNWLV